MTATPSPAPPIAAIAAILDEELAVYRRLEALAEDQADALRADALDRLSAIVAEQLALVDVIEARERQRRELVGSGATVGELMAVWGESARDLLPLRDALANQIERARQATVRNRAIIATLLDHFRERVQLALESQALYDADGQARPTPPRSIVDRRA
jgi:flagellar biosynthesis/type III secretory pathway chaperone